MVVAEAPPAVQGDVASRPPLRRRALLLEAVAVAGGYLVLTLLLTYPLPLYLTNGATYGDPMLIAWALDWYSNVFPGNLINAFNGPIFYPYPNAMFFDELFLTIALQTLPIVELTGNPLLGYNLALLAAFVASGMGVYLLVRRWTGNRTAAFVAGVLFSFSSIRMVQSTHLHVLSIQWLPLSVYFLDRWLIGRRWFDLVGFTLAFNLQLLSAYNFVVMFPLTVAAWGMVRLVAAPKLIKPVTFVGLALAGLLTAAINFPLARVYFSLSEQFAFSRDVNETIIYSASPLDYLSAPPNNWLYGPLSAPLRHPAWSEHSLFPGAVTLLFAVAGIAYLVSPASRGRRGLVLAAGVATVLLWNFSLGLTPMETGWPDLRVYSWLYDHVPAMRGVRVAARASVFVLFGMALLAGFALAWLLPRLGQLDPFKRAGARVGLAGSSVVAALIVGLAVIESASIPFAPIQPVPLEPELPPVYRWLAEQPGRGAVVELPLLLHTNESWYETARMYRSIGHGRPILNGYRGFIPPNLREFSRQMAAFPDDLTLAGLRGLGVEWVIVQRGEMPPARYDTLVQGMSDRGLEPVARFDAQLLYRLPDVPLAPAEAVSFELEAPQKAIAGENVEAWVILSNRDRAPFVPRVAEPYRLSIRWEAAGRTIAETVRYIQQPVVIPGGDVLEIPIVVNVPSQAGPLRLILEASGERAASGLRLEQDYPSTLR